MDAPGGSGNLLLEILHWLWLPILLGAATVLLSSSVRRRSIVSPPPRTLAVAMVVAVVAEMAWRLFSAATALPLAAWAAAFFVLSLAFSTVDPRSRSAEEEPLPAEPRDEGFAADNPFLSDTGTSTSPEKEASITRAFEQTRDAVAILDEEERIDFANRAWLELHGYTAEAVFRHHWSLFSSPDQLKEARRVLEAARQSGSFRGTVENRHRDGGALRLRLSLTALARDPQGGAAGFVAVAHRLEPAAETPAEMAAETPADEASEQELETLRVLASSAAHELNNLLTGILGNASLISYTHPDGPATEAQEIEDAARRASELARLLQSYTGVSGPAAETLDLSALVPDLAAGSAVDAALRFELAPNLARIAADPAQLRPLLRSLLANAADACRDKGGEITVRTGHAELDQEDLEGLVMKAGSRPGSHVFLEVADTGHGMDEPTRARIFEPFFTTRPERRGLGMVTVTSIVRAHRGAIGVGSEPGAGTRFTIYFPAAEASTATADPPSPSPEKAAAEPASPESASSESASPEPASSESASSESASSESAARNGAGKILVVDNEKIIRDLATNILEMNGFAVLTADEGAPAVALYRERRGEIGAVLLDLSMPMMDGEEVFVEIRQIDPQARVILMTGHDVEAVEQSFEIPGLAGVLQKPFRPEDLVGVLRGILGE